MVFVSYYYYITTMNSDKNEKTCKCLEIKWSNNEQQSQSREHTIAVHRTQIKDM